jgi:hypothetical protein
MDKTSEKWLCKQKAERHLESLRGGPITHWEQLVFFMKDDLRRGELSLSDIGTSEEELENLQTFHNHYR